MKRYLILALAVILAVGCRENLPTGTCQDDIALPANAESADSLLMSISLEYACGGSAGEAVNQALLYRAFDFEDWAGTVEEAATAYRENLIDEYLTENSGAQTVSWEDRINGVFTAPYKGWNNYLLTYYSYKGGAHGIQTVSPIVFDRKSGAIVSEEDLFADGWTAPVTELIRSAVTASMQGDDDELLDLVEMEMVVPNNNFSVGPDGVQWIFQPYEVGPYALGIVSATVSWKQLKPYLK